MRIPLLRWRALNDADSAESQRVVLISESLVTRFWPGKIRLDAVYTLTFSPQYVREVPGVVET